MAAGKTHAFHIVNPSANPMLGAFSSLVLATGAVSWMHKAGQWAPWLFAVGVTLVVLTLLYCFFRFTPLGLAMRAAAQNPDSSRLVGIRVGWMLADCRWGCRLSVGRWMNRAC